MTKYLLKRIVYGALSVIAVTTIIMVMVYSLMNRDLIFAEDPVYSKMANNAKKIYKLQKWEEYGYIDYVPYADYLVELYRNGEIDEETRTQAVSIAKEAEKDNDFVKEYVQKFTDYYTSQGYTVERLDAVTMGKKKLANGGAQQLYAYRDCSLANRLVTYLHNLVTVDSINYVENDLGDRGISFKLYDPLYGGEKFSPCIMGNGTKYKYLLYTDDRFPYVHQNLVKIRLGSSYTVATGVDVFDTMILKQGSYEQSMILYPTGFSELSADDLHSATYAAGSRETSIINQERFTDDYTNVNTVKKGKSRMGYSFLIGICSTILLYLFGIPLGILMAKNKDKALDKFFTGVIVFFAAVPSLAYIFMFKAVGGWTGLPTTFLMDAEEGKWLFYILPVISLSIPSTCGIMKWLRRFMIDQMNADYVKFARSGGLTEGEIFRKHILKNSIIPIVHGIPGNILLCITGALVTEKVYVVPGTGKLLIEAIQKYDNAVIVGVALFYATVTVISLILGDVLIATVDPRISFSSKDR